MGRGERSIPTAVRPHPLLRGLAHELLDARLKVRGRNAYVGFAVGGSGNFFSMVDITLTEQHLKWARAKDSRPVVIGWTNNALDWGHMTDFIKFNNATQDCFLKMGVDHKRIMSMWGTPAAILICAGPCCTATSSCKMMPGLSPGLKRA